MIPYLGDFVEDDVVHLMFNTFSSDDPSASCTITNFIDTDVHIHKDDGLTQRNNAAGITVSVNFDGITGSHMVKIDTSDDTVAGFWVAGHDYFVRVEGTTVDAATINAVICHFSIENRFMRGTDLAALAATALTDATWTDAKAVHLDANISSRNATTPPTVVAIRTEMEGVGTKLTEILEDTGTTLDAMIERILGLDQENFYIDSTAFTGANMTSCRIRIYSVAGSVGTASDVIATYNITVTYAGDNLASYKVVKA